MEPTREQLQAEILEILYQKSLQRPIWVSCAEIFWSVSNIKVPERSVKDVLDWLVKNGLVVYQADKYQIAKSEFIDMSRRKAIERKETEGNAGMGSVDGKPGLSSNLEHHPWLAQEHPQLAAESSNMISIIMALMAFLAGGTLAGILLFNNYAREEYDNMELVCFQDSIKVQQLQLSAPGYIPDDAYTINRNFRNIHVSLEAQQRINAEIIDVFKVQQSRINMLTAYSKQQTAYIEHLEKGGKIFTWMIAFALLVLSSLLIFQYWRRS